MIKRRTYVANCQRLDGTPGAPWQRASCLPRPSVLFWFLSFGSVFWFLSILSWLLSVLFWLLSVLFWLLSVLFWLLPSSLCPLLSSVLWFLSPLSSWVGFISISCSPFRSTSRQPDRLDPKLPRVRDRSDATQPRSRTNRPTRTILASQAQRRGRPSASLA